MGAARLCLLIYCSTGTLRACSVAPNCLRFRGSFIIEPHRLGVLCSLIAIKRLTLLYLKALGVNSSGAFYIENLNST